MFPGASARWERSNGHLGPVLQDGNDQSPVAAGAGGTSGRLGLWPEQPREESFILTSVFCCCCVNTLLYKQQHSGNSNYN